MNEYQREQADALEQVLRTIDLINRPEHMALRKEMESYRKFRQKLEAFLKCSFGTFCTEACFQSRTSACCSKDGIVTFWGDVVANVYFSGSKQRIGLAQAIRNPRFPHKCIYLGSHGCLWTIPPLGCALFLCDAVQDDVFGHHPALKDEWERHKGIAKGYRWPDRPVLFDRLEEVFMAYGCLSPLMYLHTSPGLLRIKKKAGMPIAAG